MDELKRTSGRARDAIRWLEAQFRQGNRFLRMQRNNEKQSIPLVSYPRKKDNEAWYVPSICLRSPMMSGDGSDDKFTSVLSGWKSSFKLVRLDIGTYKPTLAMKQFPSTLRILTKIFDIIKRQIGEKYEYFVSF